MDALAARPSPTNEATSLGTRFLVYPQPPFVTGYEKPELIWLPIPPGEIRAGPASHRAYVRDPLDPKNPYQAPYLPPFQGPCHPPVEPGPTGHFDHLLPGTRAFMTAHAFACVHRVIDIFDSYRRQSSPWFFEPGLQRLEIIPHLHWNNAQSGFGFLELGEDDASSSAFPFALNFDVIAHEVGHLILFKALGLPRVSRPSADFLAYHEAAADFISLIGLLHFDTALDRILRRTKGNLLITNELDRFAESTDEKQVRRFGNSLRLQDVGSEVHDRSLPFSGSLFDALIEIYQVLLFERGLTDLDPREFKYLRMELTAAELEQQINHSSEAYGLWHYAAKSALAEARDVIGQVLADSWRLLDPDDFTFAAAREALVAAADGGPARRYAELIADNFSWRGIAQ